MKFKVKPDEFFKDIEPVLGIIPLRTTYPTLNNIIIKAENNEITVMATDLNMSIIIKTSADITSEGNICISGKRVGEILREAKKEITFELIDKKMKIFAENFKFEIPTIEIDDYPEINIPENKKGFKVLPSDIKNYINKTSFCVATEKDRPALTGILWKYNGREMVMVGTNGISLAVYKTVKELDVNNFSVIIPPKALLQLQKIKKEILVNIEPGVINFITDNFILTTRLIEDEYPDYDSVIPNNNNKIIEIEKDKILKALKKADIVIANPRDEGVKLDIGDNIKVNTSSETGDFEENIDYKKKEGDNILINFNTKFIQEILIHIDEDIVVFNLKEPDTPVVVHGLNNNNNFYLLMPLFTQ